MPAEEAQPACLEMSGWWGGRHCPHSPIPPPIHSCWEMLETDFGTSEGDRPTLLDEEGLLGAPGGSWGHLGAPGPLGERQKRPVPRGDADGQKSVQAGFAALVGWSARKSDDALGTMECLREVYWHRLISQGTLLAAATTFPKN